MDEMIFGKLTPLLSLLVPFSIAVHCALHREREPLRIGKKIIEQGSVVVFINKLQRFFYFYELYLIPHSIISFFF